MQRFSSAEVVDNLQTGNKLSRSQADARLQSTMKVEDIVRITSHLMIVPAGTCFQ